MIGTVINRKYEIRQLISESHQYEVYMANEIETGSQVALKVMREELATSTERVRVFADEVAQFARFSHTGAAHILDLDMTGSRPYVATELVQGLDLRRWVQQGPVNFLEASKAVQSLATILYAAYEQDIPFRSIKLSNILRDDKGNLKVLSFSLPRLRVVGREDSDPTASIQSDLFFLGTTYFELLSGESPIRKRGGINECWIEKLRQSLRIRHPQLTPENMDQVVNFIDRTLIRDVTQRFTDHSAFLVALADLIHMAEGTDRKGRFVPKKQFTSASEVVDALNGRTPVPVAANAIALPAAESPGLPPAIHAQRSASETGKAASALPRGQTSRIMTHRGQALALAEELEFEEPAAENNEADEEKPSFGRPILQLIDGGKKAADRVSHIWRASEDLPWYRNPLVIMGASLLLMALLVLFW